VSDGVTAVTDHAQSSLLIIIKRSLAALRVAVADARVEPTKTLVHRVVEECETLSAAIKQLSKRVPLTRLDPATPVSQSNLDIHQIHTFARQLDQALYHGICEHCRGVLHPTENSLEEKT